MSIPDTLMSDSELWRTMIGSWWRTGGYDDLYADTSELHAAYEALVECGALPIGQELVESPHWKVSRQEIWTMWLHRGSDGKMKFAFVTFIVGEDVACWYTDLNAHDYVRITTGRRFDEYYGPRI